MNTLHDKSNLIPACLHTRNPSSPNFASRFRADVVQLVEASNIHKHSNTCYKYWNANRGDKKNCRMRMPRKLVPVSTIDPDTGHISMRRSDPMINNFNEYLITACRSNMDIKFIWSGSDAKALVYYITDYVTQMSLSFHDTFDFVQKSITSIMNSSHQTDKENAIEKSRKLVLRCYNTLASQQELSGVQVASYLMNWDDHYTTHKFQDLYLIQTELYLQTQLNEMPFKRKLEFSLQDHDEHLLQVIAEAQTDNDAIDPVLLPANQYIDGEGDMDDSENLLELLGNLDEYTTAAINATKKSTEEKYIAETIEAVENVGRFIHLNTHHQPSSNEFIDYPNQKAVPFVSTTPNLIRLNTKWQEQLKTEKERVRRSLITGNHDTADDTLDLHAAKVAVVTVVNPNSYNQSNFDSYGSILPVVSVATNFPNQTSIADEFTLNRERRAVFS
ncbi:unnamed protein product [Rotaria sp. Silwood2]|nr:unnamed protein product [Rotaria sp. Silwood2]